MKSHDCHVFMQRLLPIAFRDFLIDEVWGPLTEISNFFRALTAPIIQHSLTQWSIWLSIHHMRQKLEDLSNFVGCILLKEKCMTLRKQLFEYQVCFGLSDDQIQIKRQFEFIPWFKTTVRSGRYEVDSRLLPLVAGPVNNVRIRARAIIDTSLLSDGGNVYYQDDDPPMPQLVQPLTVLNDHVSLASQGGEQVVISEVMQLPYMAEEECVGEDDDEEEEFDGMETSEEKVPNYLTESDSD
ncbi:hypothetical protein SLE2022_056050 [Rubroshorea leprosula]